MKRNRKRRFKHIFLKHLCIMAIAWVLLIYVFLQAAFFVVQSKIEQKTAVNFYEGMENVQYLMKDALLEEKAVELTFLLNDMAYAGTKTTYRYSVGGGYTGEILGLRLGWLEHFLAVSFSGVSYDGDGNIYLGGFGKGYGFIVDAETEEIVCETGRESEKAYLYLTHQVKEGDSSKNIVFSSKIQDIYCCDKAELASFGEEIDAIKEKWRTQYQAEDPDFEKRALSWELNAFYEKGETFYPAKVSLYYRDRRGYVPNALPMILCEELETLPQNMEGYRLHEIDEEKERPTLFYLNDLRDEDSPVNNFTSWKPDEAFRKNALDDFSKSKDLKYGTRDLGEAWCVGNPVLYFLNGQMVFLRSAYFQDASGRLYKACTYQNVSELLEGNLGVVVFWAIFFAIILTILAAIFAYVRFLIDRQKLMTEEYRIVLMDSMAHDLKSPLMAIGGYAENLKAHVNDEKRDHYADEIQKSVDYMNDIVMKNLEILKFDKEKRKFKRTEVNVRRLFTEALEKYQDLTEERGLKVTVDGELTEKGDEELLQKVAENLVTNCIRYTPNGGSIQLSFGKRRFSIQNDTEIEYKGSLKRLWEPFVRGEDSRTGRGTGLGLAIAANVLDRHSWKYALKYDKDKKTFTCTVKIPWGILI